MKNKIIKKTFLIFLGIVLIALLCGCSKSLNSSGALMKEEISSDSDTEIGSTSNIIENVNEERKIIEKVELSVQTTKFEELIENTKNKIKELSGYIESSNISGREIDSNNTRWAEIKIKIPAENNDSFKSFISGSSVVIREAVTTEDVTLKYVDIESRINALQAEKASLENLLTSAGSTSDIITIRQQLTDVIYKIESYESQLRTYDNLVDYCTINLYVNEVEHTAIIEEQGTWEEIGTNLARNFEKVGDVLVNLFVFFVSTIPYMLPFGVIAIIVIVIIKLSAKSRRKKAQKKD